MQAGAVCCVRCAGDGRCGGVGQPVNALSGADSKVCRSLVPGPQFSSTHVAEATAPTATDRRDLSKLAPQVECGAKRCAASAAGRWRQVGERLLHRGAQASNSKSTSMQPQLGSEVMRAAGRGGPMAGQGLRSAVRRAADWNLGLGRGATAGPSEAQAVRSTRPGQSPPVPQTSSTHPLEPQHSHQPAQMTTPSGKLIGPRQRKIALLGSRSVGQSRLPPAS